MPLTNCVVTRETLGPYTAGSIVAAGDYNGVISQQEAGFSTTIPGVGALYKEPDLSYATMVPNNGESIADAFKITISPYDPEQESNFSYPTGEYVLCAHDLSISGFKGISREFWRMPVYDQYVGNYVNALYTGFGECHEDNPLKDTRFDPHTYKSSGLNGTEFYTYNGRTYQGLGMVALATSISQSLVNQETNSQNFQSGGVGPGIGNNAYNRLIATLEGTTSWSMPTLEGITAVAPYRVFDEFFVRRYGDRPYGELFDDWGNLIGSYSGFDSNGNACEQITLPGYVPGIGSIQGSWVEPGQDAASRWDSRVDKIVMFNTLPINATSNNPDYYNSYTDYTYDIGPPPFVGNPGNTVTVIVILKKTSSWYQVEDSWAQINDLSDINIDIDGNAVLRGV